MGITKGLRKNVSRFGATTTIIHGEYGVGKTLLAAQYPKPYFLMCENNDAYSHKLYHDNVTTWAECVEKTLDFIKGDHDFTTFVIDGLDSFYNLAAEQYVKEYNENLTGDKKALTVITDNFGKECIPLNNIITDLLRNIDMNPKYNLVLLAHSEERPIKTFTGDTYDKIVPQLPNKKSREYFFKLAQEIYYYFYVGDERYLKIIGDDLILAKNRGGNEHFRTANNNPIVNIPMPESPEKAYKYLIAAYNNKLKSDYKNINN